MQRLTSSELRVAGPIIFDAALAQPTTTLDTYHDIAVLAFKAPDAEPAVAVDPAAPVAKLEIHQAVYEADNNGGSRDVKAKILELIQHGDKSVKAGNHEMGGDPAPGSMKHLRLVFTLDGKPGTLVTDENELLIFPLNAASLARARLVVKTSIDRTYVSPPKSDGTETPDIVRSDSILDLTSKLTPEGHLQWAVPAGQWIILRIGYTPIGVTNHPAPDEGRGLECDKLSKSALDAHWAGFMQKVLDDVGPLAGRSLNASLIDSYEVGGQDWTPDFRAEFEKRRGYDPLKFLPTFTRHIVDSPAITERFLWDMRRTVADLFAENYYAHFNQLCHAHGLSSAVEPYTGPFESLQCGSTADVVMGEFWTGSSGHPSIKMCASIAHIYGKSIVGAESFTAGGRESRWQNDPYSLKTLGDLMFCQGLNRYIFHRYAMQPWMNRQPGMTMGEFGLNFERTQTWWNQGKPWIDYITHCQYLLQQGRTVCDVAYFTGESAPVEMRIGNPSMPAGYDYDAVNSDVLLHGATVEDGRIKLTSGASYSVLVLPTDDINMTPAMLDCLSKLVHDGATVIGPRPQHSPSLADYPSCDGRVKELAEELWGNCDGKTITEHAVGKGRVVWGQSLTEIFAAQKLLPDFESKSAAGDSKIAYTHRTTGDSDIYFVSNQHQQYDAVACTFRVSGEVPELWHPDTGVIEPAPVWEEQHGRTTVRLNLDPAGSVFVVFKTAAGAVNHVVDASGIPSPTPHVEHKLDILHAIYTSIDGSGTLDVTAKLSSLVTADGIDVRVDNRLLGSDPAIMHEKQLRVDYTLDGKPDHAVVHENQSLRIPPADPVSGASFWEPAGSDQGTPVARMWENGRVEFQTAGGTTLRAVVQDLPTPGELTGPWKLSFPPNLGAPPSVILDKLISWTDHPDAGVRYFSGTAAYEKDFSVTADQLKPGRELWLNLGRVKNFAEVSVNGHDLGILWKPPFRVNVTSAVKPGENKLEVKVTNLWPNRIIGDEQLPPDCKWNGPQQAEWPQWLLDGKPSPTGRVTFATWHHWDKDSSLLESGLIGPVYLQAAELAPAR
jgi:hypothetical protein